MKGARILPYLAVFLWQAAFLTGIPGSLDAGVKTSYKQYTIYSYGDREILCEPYLVKKDDWLYKIFRNKGEISESDFPKFLAIFKELNPKINNIDAIEPGIQILIPLKPVDSGSYTQSAPGIVEVPVVEFKATPDDPDLEAFVKRHEIKPGDTVSGLLDKAFLEKGGRVSATGKEALNRLNPGISNLNLIFKGTQIVLPEPGILDQPWFETFLKGGSAFQAMAAPGKAGPTPSESSLLPLVPEREMKRLERYAALIQGTLSSRGSIHFPGKGGRKEIRLDLSRTPLLEKEDGQKTLLLPSGHMGKAMGKELAENLRSFWKYLKIQEINQTLSLADLLLSEQFSLSDKVTSPDAFVKELVEATPYAYNQDEAFDIRLGTVDTKAKLGRIMRNDAPDILVNNGRVFGMALDTLEKQGFKILTIPSEITMAELTRMLFHELGYTTWKDPAFNTSERIETIRGIYAEKKETQKIFIARQPPADSARAFLERENISLLVLQTSLSQ